MFQEYAEQWRAAQVRRAGTVEKGESYVQLHAYPCLDDRALGSSAAATSGVGRAAHGRRQPSSVELAYRWVSTIFKATVGDRLIASSPCTVTMLPERTDAEVAPSSVGEIEALAPAVLDRYRALIVSGAGMRGKAVFT